MKMNEDRNVQYSNMEYQKKRKSTSQYVIILDIGSYYNIGERRQGE
jgi:hypothetical protein